MKNKDILSLECLYFCTYMSILMKRGFVMNEWKISKIKEFLEMNQMTDELKLRLLNDTRKGVHKLVQEYEKKEEQQRQLKQKFIEMSQFEREFWKKDERIIVGVDEVGRGPLAGPVVACAVVLPEDFCLLGLDDSKKIHKAKHELFYNYIVNHALDVQVGIVEAQEIDEINILQATKKAMREAIHLISLPINHVLIDAVELTGLTYKSTSIIKGDQKSISIAAASIVAKVTRDRIMKEIDHQYPMYQFKKNSGYGTKEHINAIEQYGITEIHRKSFLKSINY